MSLDNFIGNNLDLENVYMQAGAVEMRVGKRFFYESAIRNLHKDLSGGKPFIAGSTKEGIDLYTSRITFDEQGSLYEYTCNCGAMLSPANNPCPHIIALALAFEEKYPNAQKKPDKIEITARTDSIAHELSLAYEKRRVLQSDSDYDKATLTATLILKNATEPSVRFTCSKKRRYQIKNIADFLNKKKTFENCRFGVDLELIISKENFDEKSAQLLEWLDSSFSEHENLAQKFLFNNKNLAIDSSDMWLTGSQLDELLQMHSGRVLELESNYRRPSLRVVDGSVDTLKNTLLIQEGYGGYYISTDFGFANYLRGKHFDYLISSNYIYRLSKAYVETTFELLKSVANAGRVFVLKQDMPAFYNSCILSVENIINIKTDVDLSIYKAPPLNAVLKVVAQHEGAGLIADIYADYNGEVLDFAKGEFIGNMQRDRVSEKKIIAILKKYFKNYPNLVLEKDRHIFRFLRHGIKALRSLCQVELADELADAMIIRTSPKGRVGVSLQGGAVKLELTDPNYNKKDLDAILKAYSKKEGFVRLEDGSFVDLSSAQMGAIADFFSFVDKPMQSETSLPLVYASFIKNALAQDGLEVDLAPDFNDLVEKLKNPKQYNVPQKLASTLRDYQITGFRWLANLAEYNGGGILADDMGLGKSLQIISLITSEKFANKNHKKIIVCPTSLILNWVAEFTKFAPEVSVAAVWGSQKERKDIIEKALEDGNNGSEVIITSYELLRRDVELYKEYNFEFAILDEAQFIKNPATLNASTVKALKAKHRFALSGTPIENSLAELWSIFDFILPGYLYSYNRFRDSYEKAIVSGAKSTIESFNALIEPFILRRLKSEVLSQLPPKIEQELLIAPSETQRKLYDANLIQARGQIGAGAGNRMQVLALLMRLRQIACHPKIIYPDFETEVAKFEAVIEKINLCIAGGHKILLFTSFLGVMELFRERFEREDISNFTLKGDTPKSERMRLVEAFNTGDTNVFMISLKAGGTGLNLTGADVVIHYDPWWSEAATTQASDRAHRIGQEKTVQVFKAITKGTVEEGMVALAKKKAALSKLVIGTGVEKLSTDELIKVLVN